MKKFYLVLALSGIMQMGFGQAVDKSVDIPDLDNAVIRPSLNQCCHCHYGTSRIQTAQGGHSGGPQPFVRDHEEVCQR